MLKAGLAIAAAPFIPDILRPKPVLPSDREGQFGPTDAEELKTSIKKDFNVEILPAETVIPIRDNPKHTTIAFEVEDLRRLARALSELPPHFYQPRQKEENKKPFSIGLSQEKGQCLCGAHPELFRELGDSLDVVILLQKELHRTASFLDDRNVQEKEPALFQIVHEFTHAVTNTDINKYIRLIIEPLEIGEEGLQGLFASQLKWPDQYRSTYELPSPYAIPMIVDLPQTYNEKPEEYIVVVDNVIVPKEKYYVLGKKYFQKRASDFQNYFTDKPRLFSANSTLSPKTRLGYGVTNVGEFLSVAAEIYVRGQEYFIKAYEPFLGKERAEMLYAGMKQEIFRGKGY